MKLGTAGRAVVGALVVVWLSVVVVSYYLVHKPFAVGDFFALSDVVRGMIAQDWTVTLVSLLNVFGDMLVVALLIFLASGLGHFLLRRVAFDSALQAGVIWCGVGLGALGLIVFGLAVVGIVNAWIYWVLLVVGILLLRRDAQAVINNLRTMNLPRPTRGDRALAWFVALSLGVTFFLAFAPPWGWDGVQYHLITPKLILQNGRMMAPPDNLSLNNPNLVEMLFLAGMVLKGDGATQALHWIFLPLTLGAMLAFAGKYFSWRNGWLAAALLCAVPTVLLLSTWAYNDLALTFYTFTAFVFVLRARETRRTGDLVLAAVLSGFAFGEKVTAFFVPLALVVLLVRRDRAVLRDIALYLLISFALGVPWWLRNILFVGNPIYPFVFGGLYWDEFRTAWYTRWGSGLMQRPLELLIVPWTMVVQSTQSSLFQGTLGPLLLILLPLNLISSPTPEPRTRNVLRAMWFFAAALYLPWLLGVAQSKLLWQSRLLLPAFPLFALLAARGLEKLGALELKQFSVKRFVSLVIAVLLGISALSYGLALLNDGILNYFLFSPLARETYLENKLGAHYTTAQWVNANLPRDAKIMFLWEPRTYYFQPASEADAILDRFAHLRFLYKDADQIIAEWRKQGFTHVVLFRTGLNEMLVSGYDPVSAADMETLQTLEQKYLRLVYGAEKLGLQNNAGRLSLTNADDAPYAVYEIMNP